MQSIFRPLVPENSLGGGAKIDSVQLEGDFGILYNFFMYIWVRKTDRYDTDNGRCFFGTSIM